MQFEETQAIPFLKLLHHQLETIQHVIKLVYNQATTKRVFALLRFVKTVCTIYNAFPVDRNARYVSVNFVVMLAFLLVLNIIGAASRKKHNCLQAFQSGPIQTGLCNRRKRLEA